MSRGEESGGRRERDRTLGTALDSDLREALLADVERADLVVGIPSFNNAGTIDHVIDVTQEGLRLTFPSLRAIIVNSDGGSTDGTRDVVARRGGGAVPVLTGRYAGPPGKGSALRAVFEAVELLGARAGAVLDSDLRSVTAEWVARLLRPIVQRRADYVAPLYVRHKYDGTITNTLVYPAVRALYGKRVRQPIGGEFGFSADLARRFLAEDVWSGDVARFGIDVFMTTTALASGARVAQAALGAKIHDPKDPARHLGPMFEQVTAGLVDRARAHRRVWEGVRGSVAVPIEGQMPPLDPGDVRVDLAGLDAAFRLATGEDRARWQDTLCADDLAFFIAGANEDAPAGAELERAWARLVFDALASGIADASVSVAEGKALLPLYFARVAMHVRATSGLASSEAERFVERQADAFEAEKPHLLERLPR